MELSGANSRDIGFSLIEMLVALALLAVAAGLVQAALTGGWRGMIAAENDAAAIAIAQSRLATAGKEVPLEAGPREGEAPGGYHWRLTAVPKPAPAGLDEALGYWTTAEVTWREAGRVLPRRVSLTTLKIRRAGEDIR